MKQTSLAVFGRKAGDFWIFWTGQTISQIGSALTNFALPLLVFNLTGSALKVGLTLAATYLPYVLFGLVSGAWVDRVDRKVLMIGLDIARAILLGLVPLLAFSTHFPLWWIYLITFLNATLSMIFGAASLTAIPHLVKRDELIKANGRMQAGVYVAFIVGPLLATLILTHWSIQAVLWCDALTFLGSAGSLGFIRSSFNGTPVQEQSQAALGPAILEGLRYVFSHPVVYMAALLALLVNMALAPINAQVVVFAKQVLDASNTQVGVLATALGVGGVLATLAAGPLKRRLPYGILLLGSLLLAGVLTIIFAITRNFWASVILWGGIYGMVAIFNVALFSILQGAGPDRLLGRVILSAQLLAALVVPVVDVLSGLVIDQVKNVALVFGVLGVFIVVITLAFIPGPLAHVERFLLEGQSSSLPPVPPEEQPSSSTLQVSLDK
ncbi:MFS transporter [Tengunoibacter tsumagoiensis]|uniref:MFS transporter n=1 Tax=Tengunoibacter tsumagoiensis TaxID=2014871 RepID=A0A402A7Q1_9CHLR|nr:MFS transporter [Tengunoibacter tsumagoiensis]GCE15194.1 MFS transporter [Tengunoibacter tsumagoiensis]